MCCVCMYIHRSNRVLFVFGKEESEIEKTRIEAEMMKIEMVLLESRGEKIRGVFGKEFEGGFIGREMETSSMMENLNMSWGRRGLLCAYCTHYGIMARARNYLHMGSTFSFFLKEGRPRGVGLPCVMELEWTIRFGPSIAKESGFTLVR